MTPKLSIAPIQGITDYVYRNTYNSYFEGIDNYYAPYLRIDKNLQFKSSKLNDILPENNPNIKLIPQIMTNNSKEFIYMADFLFDLGYKELNWNLGCPYPMVTNRNLGAGLLPLHESILQILDEVLDKVKVKVSIKMRSGLKDDTELAALLPKLNAYSISELIIHPRYAKQLYKEQANIDLYSDCMQLTNHKLCYNGDINSLESFQHISCKTGRTDSFMLGRGIISNPFLASQIKHNSNQLTSEQIKLFWSFQEDIFEAIQNRLSGPTQVLTRMRSYWEYFSQSFTNSHKVYKRFKKAKNIAAYHDAISYIKNNEEWIA